ncbi:uncharacterized protein [Ranitomeya imitator]|uniref:uncharacterized protein n=1 Tax=Ranitomeya imitator TaxID=111125 RepID=UPI0037E99100
MISAILEQRLCKHTVKTPATLCVYLVSDQRCRIVGDQAAAACLQSSSHNRNLLIQNLPGHPPKKVAKVSKKVVEKGKKQTKKSATPSVFTSPRSVQAARQKRNIAVDEEPLDIENETLITLVEANPSIWDQSDSSHNYIIKRRKLWEKICQLDPRYLDKSASSKKKIERYAEPLRLERQRNRSHLGRKQASRRALKRCLA